MNNKTCIIIAGPTASGKTEYALQLAKYFNTEIISADSRQCFKELTIGVAKPTPQQLEEVQHYFINSHSIHDDINAKVFEAYADEVIKNIFVKHHIAVMVGGTGLYINAFCYGIDAIPPISEEIKFFIRENFENSGLSWLQDQIKNTDPLYFNNGEIKNPHRLMRALEVKLSTGTSIIEYQTRQKKKKDFNIIKIGLQMPKQQLHQNINKRVDEMINAGLVNEIKNLLPYKKLKALQTVGYKELFQCLTGNISMDEAIENIKINTRQYAKRQITWFKKDKDIQWIDVENKPSLAAILNHIF